jgi:starch synthase (maltosyl-transferring)
MLTASSPNASDAALAAATSAPRFVIDRIQPCVDDGRFPVKAVVGQAVEVSADVFGDGHDVLAAHLLWQREGDADWQRVPMTATGNDRYIAHFTPASTGLHRYTLQAWLDGWGTYCYELRRKVEANVIVSLEIEEGRRHVEAAAQRTGVAAAQALAQSLRDAGDAAACDLLLSEPASTLMTALDERRFLTWIQPAIVVDVERTAAGYASWYELFPRSITDDAAAHGTFDNVIERLPHIRDMGFDVLYFPPIHPIGKAFRKGRNNTLTPGPDDVGSPYAIGSEDGGHDAIHPQLGGIEAFRRLRDAAANHGIELALDFAVQCSQDHPWLQQHPGWFAWRPDGSIKYAENPPKKYQDIVNVDFYAPDAQPSLWLALRDVVQHWVDEGVRIFRVDNPHTKPLPFWQWLIADIRSRDPGVLFLAEAFTKPAMMVRLGKIGFTQSYTYFTWRNNKAEFTEYLTELAEGRYLGCYRPNFFVNTPDIHPFFLHDSGRPGFLIRAALATTLSGLWGLYSGFELCESAALPGREEYLDSEKYEIRPRPLRAPGDIVDEVTRLNAIRRDNPALQTHLGIRFQTAWNDQVLCYSKATAGNENFVLVAVSLDPRNGQHAEIEVPLAELGLPDGGAVEVEELMTGVKFIWRGKKQNWYFDPAHLPFAVWRLNPIREQGAQVSRT